MFSTTPLVAQLSGRGTIQGTISDSTGAVVPGANVDAVLDATGETTDQTTTSAGFYSMPQLKPGTYTITVTSPGFQLSAKKNITLDALQVLELNIPLQIGTSNETVTITAAAAPLGITNADAGLFRAGPIGCKQLGGPPIVSVLM
jgi:hypothetical protein